MSLLSRRNLSVFVAAVVLVAGIVVLGGQSSPLSGAPSAPNGTARSSAVSYNPSAVNENEADRSVLQDRWQPTAFPFKGKGEQNK